MADTLKIANRSPMPLRMEVTDKNADGSIKGVRSAVINGSSAEAGFPEGVTDGVDATLYNDWIAANPDHAVVTGGILRVVGDDEPVTEYGFEAGLAAAAADADNVALTEKGSTITEEGPVSAEDMAATSDTPNNDLPTSQSTGGFDAPTQAALAPAAAKVPDVFSEPAPEAPATAAPVAAEPVDKSN